MKILHTADWHLGHRLGRIDRSGDLRRAVERVVTLCLDERADVLLVCGDLFDNVSHTEKLRESVQHLCEVFATFFAAGGTVLAITGNHDKEHQASILQQAMRLAAPADTRPGDTLAPGRFYLFTGPTFFRLPDPAAPGTHVQFVMMPWPTATRYLDEPGQKFPSTEERNRTLRAAFNRRLNHILTHPAFDKGLHSVLAAHVITRGAGIRPGLGLNESDAVVLDDAELPTAFAYVALGDVHKPQCLMGLSHVRYAGSIERLDLNEGDDQKGVVVVEVGPGGRQGEPQWVPLESTPVYRVRIDDPPSQVPVLAERFPDHDRALVNLHVTYQPGRDNLNSVLAELERVFPYWYDRHWEATGGADSGGAAAGATAPSAAADPARIRDTVCNYLADRLAGRDDVEELLALAESLLAEEAEGAAS